jgi:SOS-response transcriptional repressor LexA
MPGDAPSRRTIRIVPADAAADQGCSGGESFALMVLGDSMAPEFTEGEIIVVEPDGVVGDGSFVIAQVAGEWIFRQLARSATGWRLTARNPAYPATDLGDLTAVRGVVIQKVQPGRRRALKRYVD